MSKKLWTFISYLFHPALMPTLGTFVVLWNDPNLFIPLETEKPWLIVLAVVFICTYILPILLSWALLKLGRISSISHPTDTDRHFILAFTSICYILVFYCFHNIPTGGLSLKIFVFSINIALIATFITNLITKVSFHAVGVGGLFGTIIGLIHYTQVNLISWLVGAFAIMLITSTARYKLKAHGLFEIYLGLIIGIATQSLAFFFRMH